mgnify:CR=1 FL=1
MQGNTTTVVFRMYKGASDIFESRSIHYSFLRGERPGCEVSDMSLSWVTRMHKHK